MQGYESQGECPICTEAYLWVKSCCPCTCRGAAVTEAVLSSGAHHQGLVGNRERFTGGLQEGKGGISVGDLSRSIYSA